MGLIQKPYVGIQLNRNHPLARGLVGCWMMNEATGDTVSDLSGNGNHNTFQTPPDWVADGLDFNGSDDWMCTPVINHDIGAGDFSYSAIIRVDAYTGTPTGETIIANGNYAPAIVVHDTDHKLGVYFGGVLNLGTSVLSLGTTYHVCVVRKDGIITGYVDGVAGSSPVSRTTSVANAETVIGRSGITFSGDYTNGLISHVLFHKRALSPEEVTLLNRESYAMFQYESLINLYSFAVAPPIGNPLWYYNLLKRRNA